MSRRESIDSDPKRHRSKLDREPSPKRSRREGKPESERVLNKKDLDRRDHNGTETDKKPRHSLRDAAPLEPTDARGSRNNGDKNHSRHQDTDKQASHLSQGHRSRPYTQHDDRRSDGKDDRRDTSERGSWRSSRDQSNRRSGDDDKSQHHRKDQDRTTWRHDKFHESEDKQGSLSRKRPAFREYKKITEESEEAKDRNWRSNLHSDRHERQTTGRDRAWNRDEDRVVRSRVSARERFSNNGRSGFGGGWTKGEKKWDHDLFDEANKSPAKATEEEQIAKVEALLASS